MNFERVLIGVNLEQDVLVLAEAGQRRDHVPEFDCTVPQASDGVMRANGLQSAICCSATLERCVDVSGRDRACAALVEKFFRS